MRGPALLGASITAPVQNRTGWFMSWCLFGQGISEALAHGYGSCFPWGVGAINRPAKSRALGLGLYSTALGECRIACELWMSR